MRAMLFAGLWFPPIEDERFDPQVTSNSPASLGILGLQGKEKAEMGSPDIITELCLALYDQTV